MAEAPGEYRGFLVHAYADLRRDRLYLLGRLEDGRSFVAVESRWRPSLHIPREALPRCGPLLKSIAYEVEDARLESFSGREDLVLLRFSRYRDRGAAVKLLEAAGIPSPEGDAKPPEAFLSERGIRGGLLIRGESRPGRQVNLVFPDPALSPPEPGASPAGKIVPLRIASIDIETNTQDNSIRAIGTVYTDASVLLGPQALMGPPTAVDGLDSGGPEAPRSRVRVLLPGRRSGDETPGPVFYPDEPSLLRAFVEDIQTADPDVLTGWNFLDFDFPRLAERCAHWGIPFALGRSQEEAKFFAASTAAEEEGDGFWGGRRRSAAAYIPGRQVIDALRIVRAGPKRFPAGESPSGYTLEAVSRAVLGEGKSVAAAGTAKIAELDRLYQDDPVAFGNYCYRDAELVLRILQKTGLFHLTMERAGLTGVFLDKAWTSVVSFERIYGMELQRQGIAAPLPAPDAEVSGAAGGTVLDSLPGLFKNIAVFDFRSLYPTIMRTFNIDPLSHARASPMMASQEDGPLENGLLGAASSALLITAPNGAAFSRKPGILPALIAEYFAARRKALDAGDENAAHVYKILMNSFYGVLGTGACRYGRTELAGAITSFARKWLLLSRDWFTARNYPVLYGDTDSLFVETSLGDDAGYEDFRALCETLAAELNLFLTERIREEYQVESFLELRFEKAYRRLLIPPLRGPQETGETRGRAKGYGGLLLHEDGRTEVEVKGMEAVRSDVTPLARRLQLDLLELVFAGGGEAELRAQVLEILKNLRSGNLDDELVYRKRLSRPPETYTASTPPQVKAARLLGWKGRRGTVEYVWTLNGPEPFTDESRQPLPHHSLDYDHYTDSQVLPVARSIAAALGWRTELFPQKGRNREELESGQMELGW